jgi:hypothetical protein
MLRVRCPAVACGTAIALAACGQAGRCADAPVFPYGADYFRKSKPPEPDWARDHETAARLGVNTFRPWCL